MTTFISSPMPSQRMSSGMQRQRRDRPLDLDRAVEDAPRPSRRQPGDAARARRPARRRARARARARCAETTRFVCRRPSAIRSPAVVTTVHGADRIRGSMQPVAEPTPRATSSRSGSDRSAPNGIGPPGPSRRRRALRRRVVRDAAGCAARASVVARHLRGSLERVGRDASRSAVVQVLGLEHRVAGLLGEQVDGLLVPRDGLGPARAGCPADRRCRPATGRRLGGQPLVLRRSTPRSTPRGARRSTCATRPRGDVLADRGRLGRVLAATLVGT